MSSRSIFIFVLFILYLFGGESIRFGNQLTDKRVDTNFETMGEARIDQFSVINDITTLEVDVGDSIGIDEIWVLDFQPLDYNGQLPIILTNGSLSSSHTGTCSSIYRDAAWEDDYFDDDYFISSTGKGEKYLYNTFVRGNTTENNQRQNEIAFSGDLTTLLECQQEDGTNAWNFEVFDEEIQYQSLLYASNVRPISPTWSPALGTKLQVAYVQTHFRLIWRLSRFAILKSSIKSKEPDDKRHFLIIGEPVIVEEVGVITVLFDYAIVDAVYENGFPNPSKTYLMMGISTRITNGKSIMLSFKNNSLEYIPRTKGNAIDFIHQLPSSSFHETPGCKSFKLEEVCEQSWYYEFEISLNLTGISQDVPIDATGDFIFAFFTYQCDNLYNKSGCELLDIDPWYLSADVTLQTVITVVDEEQEQIKVNIIQLSNDKGVDLRGGTAVGYEDNVTLTVSFSPAFLRDDYILEMSLFMVCLGVENSESTRGCLAADEDDRYTGFVSDDFQLNYDPATDPVVIESQASSESEDAEEYEGPGGSHAGQSSIYQDEDGFQWTLVMKATAGISEGSLYETWASPGGLNEMDPEARGLDTTFAGHYKNSIVDRWDLLQVRKVKVALYTAEEEVIFLIFDADGSNAENWFSQDRLVDSTFTDIKSGTYFNYFSISGHSRANLNRRWFINKSYGGCGNDNGWFVVIDGSGPCPWENLGGAPPQFLYTPGTTHHRWQEGSTQSADIFTIFIEHLYFPVPSLTSTNFVHTQETPNLYSFIRGPPRGPPRNDTPPSKDFNLVETENSIFSTPYFIMVPKTTSNFPAIITDDPNDVAEHFTLNSTFYAGNQQSTSDSTLLTVYSAYSLNSDNLISYVGETDPLMLTCSSFINIHDPDQYFIEYTAVWVDISRHHLAYFLQFRDLSTYLLNLCNTILIHDIDVDELRSYTLLELEEVFVDQTTLFQLLASLQYFTEMNFLHDDLYTVLNIATGVPAIHDEDGVQRCRPGVIYDIMYVLVVTQGEDLLDFVDPLGNLNIAMTFIYNLIDRSDILLPTAVFRTLTRSVLTGVGLYNETRLTVKRFLSDLYEYLTPRSTISVPYLFQFEEEFYRAFVDIILGRNATLYGQKLVPHPFETDQPEYIGGRFRQGYIETCHIHWDKIIQFCTYSDPHYRDISAYEGGWDAWGEWSLCSLSCEGGVQTRTRQCLDDINGCFGDPDQSGSCNTIRCDIFINKHNFATQVTFIDSTKTFAEAEEYCNDIGGHLPDVDDLNMRIYILTRMTTEVASMEAVYVIGSGGDDVYHQSTGECKLLKVDGNVAGVNCSTKFKFFCHSDFVNVFKVEAGSGVGLYDLWTGSDTLADTLDSNASSILSTENFKSHYIEEWDTGILIEEVRIMLLDYDLKSVCQMTFDGNLTDKIDWFSEDHVRTTQYKNFDETRKTFFSIQGNKRAKRRFFINRNYQGCHLDSGWLLVLDDAEVYCAWEEKFTPSIPQFLYSGSTSDEVWAENDNYARMFVISLKFKNQPALPGKNPAGPVAQKYSTASITPPTPDQQINLEEYDVERAMHQSEFTNRALSGDKADYTLTAVYTLVSKQERRKREVDGRDVVVVDDDDDDGGGRHRRSLAKSVKEPQIRSIAFSFHGCPEGSMFNPIDRACDCIVNGYVIHQNVYKCLNPAIITTDNNNNNEIEIMLEDDYSNSSTKNILNFSLVLICFCLIVSY